VGNCGQVGICFDTRAGVSRVEEGEEDEKFGSKGDEGWPRQWRAPKTASRTNATRWAGVSRLLQWLAGRNWHHPTTKGSEDRDTVIPRGEGAYERGGREGGSLAWDWPKEKRGLLWEDRQLGVPRTSRVDVRRSQVRYLVPDGGIWRDQLAL
jgi:hypothetical protein